MLWTLWLTYGAFYFCRTNISAALPGLEAGLELSKTQIGFILGALKIAYGLGQFVNGQLAEKISPRKLLAVGMLGSAVLNVVFGFGAALYFLIFVWACNGYAQSLGWTPCMRVAANWIPFSRRGRAIGLIGTGYQVTAALTFVIAGGAVEWHGHRQAAAFTEMTEPTAANVEVAAKRQGHDPQTARTIHGLLRVAQAKDGSELLAVVQDKQAVAPARALALETLNDLADPRRDEALRFAEATGNSFLSQAAERLRKKLNNTPPTNPAVVLKRTRQRAHRTIEVLLGRSMAFFLPAVLLAGASLVMFFFLRERPPEQDVEQADELVAAAVQNTIWQNIRLTLTNPTLWFLAVALGLLNACRYGFLDWGLTHLLEETDTTLGKAGLKYAVLPIGGIAGAYWSGWITDRWFGGRRMPVICLLLVLLGVLTLVYNYAIQAGTEISIVLLLIIGFAIYGPQVLLVGTAPIDMARQGAAAAAVGFVNFMGYLGAFAGDQVTGWLKDRHEWHVPLMFWAGCAFAAAAAVACLWNTRAGDATGEEST